MESSGAEYSAGNAEADVTRSNQKTKQLLKENCCTTSKKQTVSRRCRPEDGFTNVNPLKLKPYNAFTPISELRQFTSRVPGSSSFCNSFEANQSFPCVRKRPIRYSRLQSGAFINERKSPFLVRFDSITNMDRVRVDGSNGVRFTAFRPKSGFYSHGVGSPYNNSYIASTSDSFGRLPKSDINPNKAVFTIDSKTSQILIVNRNACELLGYSSRELCEMQFTTLLLNKNKMHASALAEGQLNSEDGTVIILSGKVVELCTKYDKNVAVSLWVRQIDNEGQRCLAVAEPVERRVAQLVVDKSGYIISGDNEALTLFQLDSVEKFNGMDVVLLIPAIQLPDPDSSLIAKHIRKQKATGKTQDGVSFPLCLLISHHETCTDTTDSGLSNANSHAYLITIWVYTNLSGLLVIDENSIIESCNHHFSMLMFGFPQVKTIGEHITKLIPNFGQESDCLTRSRNATLSSLCNDESETETDHVELENDKERFLQNPINDIQQAPGDAISPIKEPRKVCLDFTSSSNNGKRSVNSSAIEGKSHPGGDVGVEQTKPEMVGLNQHGTVVTVTENEDAHHVSEPEVVPLGPVPANVLYLVDNSENNRNYGNVSNNAPCNIHLKACSSNLAVSCVSNNSCSVLAAEEFPNLTECDLLTPVNDNSLCMNLLHPKNLSINESKSHLYTSEDINSALLKDSTPASAPPIMLTPRFVKPYEHAKGGGSLVTSTPDQHKRHSAGGINEIVRQMGVPAKRTSYADGKYRGEAIHHDGNVIDIIYTISHQLLPCGRKVYCIWISRDPESSYNNLEDANVTLTFNSITSTIENSLGPGATKSTNATPGTGGAAVSQSRPNSVSLVSQCEEEQVFGEYNKHYTTIKQIGKGAYGYVKLSYRNTDRLLVISKFILKEKLCSNFMITSDDKREIPMEIYLLTHVKHPNIVTVFDVFENEKFFQLVMEVHGSGMDLFEFIDRRPAMTETLGCYIFRQIANAVDYLHSLNILHRDIKDENIIIDQHFHVKLIDFGSATFMQEGKLFSTFYGTTEYCSPEVLAGNKYAGPELEMWSLGVTLYVLMFFENPFLDIEETLKSELIIPQEISPELEYVLLALLDKNPKTRITMRQLIGCEWMTQEINPMAFNFAEIVPCEPYEVNPDKYYNGQIYSSQTGLSTSPHSLSLVDDEDDGEDEDDEHHAHIDDSFVDPEELQEDDICPLMHDDEIKQDRSYGMCDSRLTKGIHSLTLQDHPETKSTPCHSHRSLAMPPSVDAPPALPKSAVLSTGKLSPCFDCRESCFPVSVPSLYNPPVAVVPVPAPGYSKACTVEPNTKVSSATSSSSSNSVIVCANDSHCGARCTASLTTEPEACSSPTAIKALSTPSLLSLQVTSTPAENVGCYNKREPNRQSLCDSSCSTTPSLMLPTSSVLMCTMMPYSVLTSADSCCSSITNVSSSYSPDRQYRVRCHDDTVNSSAADTPTNCCSQELLDTAICVKPLKKKGTLDDASSNVLLLDTRHYAPSSASTSPCSSLTSSKSENNIFDGSFSTFSSIYDVVSMDSVTDAASVTAADNAVLFPFHGCAIDDLSRPSPPPPPPGFHDFAPGGGGGGGCSAVASARKREDRK